MQFVVWLCWLLSGCEKRLPDSVAAVTEINHDLDAHEVEILDLPHSSSQEQHFPYLRSASNPKIAEKINAFLQETNLDVVPGTSTENPFVHVENAFQYLATDWTRVIGPRNILTLSIRSEATGAYIEASTEYFNFDLRTGDPVRLSDVFTSQGLVEMQQDVRSDVRKTITTFVRGGAPSTNWPEDVDRHRRQQVLYLSCLKALRAARAWHPDVYFSLTSISFVSGRCSPHALRDIDVLWEFTSTFSYVEIRDRISTYGLSLVKGVSQTGTLRKFTR